MNEDGDVCSMGSASYGFDGLRVVVSASTRSLEWLDEFLLPWLGTSAGDRVDYRLRLTEDDAAYSALVAACGQSDVEPAIGFIRDGAPAMLAPLNADTANGRSWWFDAELRVFYSIAGTTIDILAETDTREVGFALGRVLRELVMERTFTSGAPVLHAAAVGRNGRAALVLGDRGAGKTTFSAYCMARLGFDFIANDRASVLADAGGGFQVQGIPTLVRVRSRSLGMLPEVPWRRIARPFSSRRTLAEALRLNRDYIGETVDDVYLSPAQYSWLLGAQSVAAMPLRLLLFPKIEAGLDGIAFERLTREECLDLLGRAAFSERVPLGRLRVFAPGNRTAAPSAEIGQQLAQLSVAIPAWRCRLGANAYTDRHGLTALFDAL